MSVPNDAFALNTVSSQGDRSEPVQPERARQHRRQFEQPASGYPCVSLPFGSVRTDLGQFSQAFNFNSLTRRCASDLKPPCLTFDMSCGRQTAKLAGARPLDGIRRDFPPSSNGVEAPRLSCDLQSETEKGKPMYEITRGAIVRVGADLAKRVIQVHAVDAAGRRVVGRGLQGGE